MCGICGKLMFNREASVPASLISDMANTISHRGPDDDGFYVSGPIGLGFRRLSIIDLEGGHQPLSNEDGTAHIVFNGEIYNYRILREELIARGHTFTTNSDTEVIVHLYEDYGVDCVQKLRGMFGFALWDEKKQRLMLARDRVGIKPLYFYVGKKFISFASEMKAVLADPEVEREVDHGMIDRFLSYYYLPGGQTLFKNLLKLEPGHVLVAERGHCKIRRYWDLDFSPSSQPRNTKVLEEELLALLRESVSLHMISDVPVGFLLSGGLDSTAMLSLASKATNRPTSTFTVGFSSDWVVDERPFARLVAERFGSKHFEITVSPDEFATFLPKYVWHMEEPICEPPAIALYFVSQLARQHVKVLISGEGGDEAFAGYENYRNIFWFERLKALVGPLRSPAGKMMIGLGRLLDSRVLGKYAPRMHSSFEEYYWSRTSTPFNFFNSQANSLYSDTMLETLSKQDSIAPTREYLARAKNYDLLSKMLYVDTHTWLPDDLLVKADKMTMANSVELRVPLLDHKVLEFTAGLHRTQKIRFWKMKYLAKRTLRTEVPKEILYRRKAGFPVPYAHWLRTSMRRFVSDVLLDSAALARGYFNRSGIEDLLEKDQQSGAYSKEIFSLLVLELWHQLFVDETAAAGLSAQQLLAARS